LDFGCNSRHWSANHSDKEQKMKLKAIRAERMESQWSLSRETGIHQSKISLFERGYIKPSDDEKQKIADALNVSVDQIDWDIQRGGQNEREI
jgi:DNA-binding XRE family transcriptional regulator